MVSQQNSLLINLITISIVLVGINSAKLPNYITPCKRNDPDFDKCVVKQGQAAIPQFAKGVQKFRVPVLDPMEIVELRVNQGNNQIGLQLILKNIKMHGMGHAKFVSAKTDFDKKYAIYKLHHDKVVMLSDYEVDGKILVLPIKGNGKSNITITDINIEIDQRWEIIKKNGKDHVNITDYKLKMTNGRSYFKLENLFNGDKTLGDNMNAFLNENWKEVTEDVGPAITEGLEKVFAQVTKNLVNAVSYDELYPPV